MLVKRDEQLGFWLANKLSGGGNLYRILKYGLVSHWKSEIFRDLTLCLSVAITIEISLSYLGFGVQEPIPSIGNILAAHIGGIFGSGSQIVFVVVIAFVVITAFPGTCLNLLGFSSEKPKYQKRQR